MIQKLRPVLILISVLWVVEALDIGLQLGLVRYGVRPRTTDGLLGVPLMPFLHGGWDHLIANTVPLVVLGWLAMLAQPRGFFAVTAPIVVLGGLGTWAIGAPGSVHVGASGLIFGYFGFVVAGAVFGGRIGLLLLGAIAIGLFGGIVWGILPSQPQISWQAHLCGLVAGLLTGYAACRGEQPAPRAR